MDATVTAVEYNKKNSEYIEHYEKEIPNEVIQILFILKELKQYATCF